MKKLTALLGLIVLLGCESMQPDNEKCPIFPVTERI